MPERKDLTQSLNDLGFVPSLGALPPRATICARTYVDAGAAEATGATEATLAASLPPSSPEHLPLPTITLGFPAGTGGVVDPPSRSHDLEVSELLGEGGMGRVYVAQQRSLGRTVAVKVLRSDAPDTADVASLVAEARTAGMLEHPRIVPVHALGVDAQGRPLLVMKRVRGVAWSSLLDDGQHPAWGALLGRSGGDRLAVHLEVLSAVCDALDCAHAAGVVHRDVKPDNVLVGEWGEAYLTDWGIAAHREDLERAGAPHAVVGTPAYMAPEMVLRDVCVPDARTDVYLLGATLHEVLTGRPRHDAKTLMGALNQACLSEPWEYPPAVPEELAALCNRATSRDPSARPESAGAFRAALQEFSRHRVAVRLADEASARLVDLEAASSSDVPEAGFARLATECRFGFLLALREWPEHAGARRGLDACIGRVAERELSRGAVGAARALLAELSTPRPDLEARAAELDAQAAADSERAAGNERIARDRDLTTEAPTRAAFGVALAVFVAVTTGWGAHSARLTVDDLIRYQIVMLLFVLAVHAASRHRGIKTEIDRQLSATAVVSNVLLLANRLLLHAVGASVDQVLVGDMVLIATFFCLVATFAERRFYASAAVALAGAAAAALWPERAPVIFAVSTSAAIGLTALVWLRWRAVAARATRGQ